MEEKKEEEIDNIENEKLKKEIKKGDFYRLLISLSLGSMLVLIFIYAYVELLIYCAKQTVS